VRLQGGDTEQEPGDAFVNDLAVDATSVYFVQDGEGGSLTNGLARQSNAEVKTDQALRIDEQLLVCSSGACGEVSN
jgi:hypothetical protein